MVYLSGDTHGEFNRFSTKAFPEQKEMTKDDIVIILGDFGGVWYDDKEERYWLDWLNDKPFTVCFVDGNHEHFDRLNTEFPVVDFHGGKAHQIRDDIFHLMRGYIFDFEGKSFFAMGGASSHDIRDGILDPDDFKTKDDFYRVAYSWRKQGREFRIKGETWWPEELPSQEEMDFGYQNLVDHNFEVDYVISHCLPQEVAIFAGFYEGDSLTFYFQKLLQDGLKFTRWYCGHYHRNERYYSKFDVLFDKIVRIL